MTLNIPGSCGIYSPSPVQYSSFVVLLNVFVLLCRYLAHIDFCYIFQKEPELLSGNDVLWTFVNFAGEDRSFYSLKPFVRKSTNLLEAISGARMEPRKVWHGSIDIRFTKESGKVVLNFGSWIASTRP